MDDGNRKREDFVSRDVNRNLDIQTRIRQISIMEALGILAGGMSHDLNNILASIISNAEIALIHELESSHPARFSLEEIVLAAGRAVDLVQQILNFSRWQEHTPAAVDVAPSVKEVIKLVRAAVSKGIEIHSIFEAEETFILGDPARIQQLMMSLLTYAIQAMGQRGGRISVTVKNSVCRDSFQSKYEKNKTCLDLVVSASGMAMPALEAAGSEIDGVHHIVEELNGWVQRTADPGQGGTVWVQFPVIQVSETKYGCGRRAWWNRPMAGHCF